MARASLIHLLFQAIRKLKHLRAAAWGEGPAAAVASSAPRSAVLPVAPVAAVTVVEN